MRELGLERCDAILGRAQFLATLENVDLRDVGGIAPVRFAFLRILVCLVDSHLVDLDASLELFLCDGSLLPLLVERLPLDEVAGLEPLAAELFVLPVEDLGRIGVCPHVPPLLNGLRLLLLRPGVLLFDPVDRVAGGHEHAHEDHRAEEIGKNDSGGTIPHDELLHVRFLRCREPLSHPTACTSVPHCHEMLISAENLLNQHPIKVIAHPNKLAKNCQ